MIITRPFKYFSTLLPVKAVRRSSSSFKMVVEAVCKENDISEGEMKQFVVGPGKILLTKHKGVVSAVSAKCTHYGAPLITGAFSDGHVRCPWHGACFNTVSGDIEDYPGLDSLHKYEVSIKDGKIFVTADEESLTNFRRVKEMGSSCDGEETILLLGGGAASLTCAETLRQEGFRGRLIMAGQEVHPPYDRPKLSKQMHAKASALYLRTETFLKEKNISLVYKKAVSVDASSSTVTFDDNSTISYNKLFVATGGNPRKLQVPGSDLENVCYLRSPEDGNRIAEIVQGKNVVVIGTGFIGTEVAAYLSSKASTVSIIGRGGGSIPFQNLLGVKVGRIFIKSLTDKGVRFHLDHAVKEIKGTDGKVSGVVLADGTSIPCDVVIPGIGVVPSTDFMKGANLDKRGHLVVNEFMCAGDDIYGGGDIVSYPYCYDEGKYVNIGHWQLSQAHGRCAALNMLGKQTPIRTVPFFWTKQLVALQYTGHCESFDDIIFEGDVDAKKFAAYYCRDDKVLGVACMGFGARALEMAFKLENGTCPTASQLRRDLEVD